MKKILSVLLFLLVWHIAALLFDSPVIFPGPAEVLKTIYALLPQNSFQTALKHSFLRVSAAFGLSVLLGVSAGLLSGRFSSFKTFFRPWITAVRSTPVLSIILLAIIWFKTPFVPVFVAILVGFPIVAGNVEEGIRQVDRDLIEMSGIFKVSRKSRLFHLYLPSIIPYIFSGISTAMGIIWKAVVAAEVLSMPERSIGTGMQIARSRLDTDEVFAWTAAAVLLASISEAVIYLSKKIIIGERRFS